MKLAYYMGDLYTLAADGDPDDALVIMYDKKRCVYLLPPGLQVVKDVGVGGALIVRGKYDVPAESVPVVSRSGSDADNGELTGAD